MARVCYTDNCNNPIFSHNRCKYCQNQRTDDKWIRTLEKKKSVSTGFKTSPVRSSQIANEKVRKGIKPISDKLKEELKLYRVLRDEYMRNHEVCEVRGCEALTNELHHKKPRAYHLCDVSIFMAVCCRHHDMIDKTHDAWARENGYKLNHL